MNENPKLIKILVFLWLMIGIVFAVGVLFSISSLVLPSISPGAIEYDIALSLGFFIMFSIFSGLLFVCSFFAFLLSYASNKGKKWARKGGLLLSFIFLLIFLIPIGFFIWLAIEWPSVFFRNMIGILFVVIAIAVLFIDIGIIICLTRSQVKTYFEKS
jgi:hypothetical protein